MEMKIKKMKNEKTTEKKWHNKMKEKKILYDHRLDKKNLNKWKTNTKLVKVSLKELPLYLQNHTFHMCH